MLARIQSGLLQGVDALACEVEVDLDERGVRSETIVGLPDAAVRESLERVRAAIGNTGFGFPQAKVLINLAPADVRKEGPVYDLPIAIGLLAAQGSIARADGLDPARVLFAGELALDGRLRPIRGAIAIADLARRRGLDAIIMPAENAPEASVVAGVNADGDERISVFGVRTLTEAVGLLNGELDLPPQPAPDIAGLLTTAEPEVDFAEVKGQEAVKRAIIVAAAGGHNLLMLGPAGTGKTMMARALPGILPPLSPEEALEVTRVHSAAGSLPSGTGLIRTRPVRAPHHTASPASVVGGGVIPRPGEVSLAHHGVLFLDELPEFPRTVLETLRQPLEDREVTIARAQATLRFPASFMLVAALNPTQSGEVAPGGAGQRDMDRYLSRLSGPLLDRIDIHVHAPRVPFEELRKAPTGTGTSAMRDAVLRARAFARTNRDAPVVNARLSGAVLDQVARLEGPSMALLRDAVASLGLSARAYDKIRRIARTIADLGGCEGVGVEHIAEAVQYRQLDRRV